MKKILGLSAALVALFCAAPLSAQAVTIVNGSFEQGSSVVPAGGFLTVNAGMSTIPGWTVTGNSVDWVGTYWQASDGTHSIDLNGNDTGGLTQTLTGLTPGKIYTVGFDIAGNPDNGPNIKTGMLEVGIFSSNYFFDIAGNSRSDMGWEHHFMTFAAAGSTANLSFSSTTPGAWGPTLDNVTISAVPEISTWAMMGIGFLGLGVAGRKRLRRAELA